MAKHQPCLGDIFPHILGLPQHFADALSIEPYVEEYYSEVRDVS